MQENIVAFLAPSFPVAPLLSVIKKDKKFMSVMNSLYIQIFLRDAIAEMYSMYLLNGIAGITS